LLRNYFVLHFHLRWGDLAHPFVSAGGGLLRGNHPNPWACCRRVLFIGLADEPVLIEEIGSVCSWTPVSIMRPGGGYFGIEAPPYRGQTGRGRQFRRGDRYVIESALRARLRRPAR